MKHKAFIKQIFSIIVGKICRFQAPSFKLQEVGSRFQASGLTLIELLVALVMLGLVMTAVVTIFTAAVRGQTKSLASAELVNQTSYAIEYMGRALRMARKDDNLGSCTGTAYLNYVKTEAGQGIKFLNYYGRCQEFRLNTTTGRLQERKSTDHTGGNFASWLDVTSGEVEVTSFNIGPDDSWDQNDDEQPRVTIFLHIKSNVVGLRAAEQAAIKVQTSISQRNLDVYVE